MTKKSSRKNKYFKMSSRNTKLFIYLALLIYILIVSLLYYAHLQAKTEQNLLTRTNLSMEQLQTELDISKNRFDQKPDDVHNLYNLISLYFLTGDYNQSLNFSRIALDYSDSESSLSTVRQLRGWNFLRLEDYDKAISEFETSIEYEPNYKAHIGLAAVYINGKDEYEKSLTHIEKAQHIKGDIVIADYYLAHYYYKKMEYHKAKEHIVSYLNKTDEFLYKDIKKAKNLLQEIEEKI